jgi:hypothetical protein
MARHVEIQMLDDLDLGLTPPRETGAVATVSFALDGQEYEIDLSQQHLDLMRGALEPFSEVARRIPATRTGKARKRPQAQREERAAARAWARSQGYRVKDRGRIPEQALEDWEKAGKPGLAA